MGLTFYNSEKFQLRVSIVKILYEVCTQTFASFFRTDYL
jgi:hypothetical protein